MGHKRGTRDFTAPTRAPLGGAAVPSERGCAYPPRSHAPARRCVRPWPRSPSLSAAPRSPTPTRCEKKPAVAVDENGIYPNLAAKMQIS